MSGEERGDDLDKAKDKAQDKAKDKPKTRMASLPSPDELDIQAAGSSSDRLQSVATSSEQAEQLQNIQRTGAGPTTLRLEQLQLQQQYQQNQNIRSGWQFQKMHCAVISILMIVLMLTLLDVWMAYLDSSTPTRRDHEPGAETWMRTRDLRNLTAGERNLTGES